MKVQSADWTQGAPILCFLRCVECAEAHYLPAVRCPDCGGALEEEESARRGNCVAESMVPAKYGLGDSDLHVCIVWLDEGFRVLCFASTGVSVGDRVTIDFRETTDGSLRPYALREDL